MSSGSHPEIAVLEPRVSGSVSEIVADQTSGSVQYGEVSIPSPRFGAKVDVAVGYRRWAEFDQRNGVGQDAACVRGDAHHVVGVVADGVSQSFYGDIAAQQVSRRLFNTLWERRRQPPEAADLERSLKQFEAVVEKEFVLKRRLPAELFEMQRDALEATRLSGSQTVFAAFVLDIERRCLHLYQVGDVDAVVHFAALGARVIQADAAGRWSSAGKSRMLLRCAVFDGVSGVVLRSDGTGAEWGLSIADGSLNRAGFEALSARRADLDDVSFVAVNLIAAPGAVVPAEEPERRRGAGAPAAASVPLRDYQRIAFTATLGIAVGLAFGLLAGWQLGKHAAEWRPAVRGTRVTLRSNNVPPDRFINNYFREFSDQLDNAVAGLEKTAVLYIEWPEGWSGSLVLESAVPGGSRPFRMRLQPTGEAHRLGSIVEVPAGSGAVELRWQSLSPGQRETGKGTLTVRSSKFYVIELKQGGQ